jgi:hypothetical protein
MFKRTISALAVAAIAYVGVAQAQENATLTLKSGERISGVLLDHGGVGFTIKVNNEERQIPTNDVAVIDFADGNMTNEDWARVSGGQHILWLRSGETVTGQFHDLGGTSPLNITMRTATGDRVITSSDISRLVLARTDAAAAAAANAPATVATTGTGTASGTIVVSSTQRWTRTGITVRQGETLTFNSTGEVQMGLDAEDIATPAGAKSGRLAPGAPLPNSLAGALIGRIGNGRPFGIGDQTSIPAPASGQLFLGINDDQLNDNTGEFRVEITRSGGPVRRQ